ncbi:MAG: response regulator [Planctomyces sp.]|nr:response regulator [Planctomyces sp.]
MSTDSPTALIVDDDSIAREMLRVALQKAGFVCESAADGKHALELISHQLFDLVVTDLCLPNTNGHSIVRQLLASESPPLIVVHTALTDPRITTELMCLGVDDILYKPSCYATFAAKMKVVISRRRQSRLNANVHFVTFRDGIPIEYVDSSAAVETFVASQVETNTNHEIEVIVDTSEELRAELMKLARSPTYNRLGREITSAADAISMLGRRRVSDLALQVLERSQLDAMTH